MVRMRCLCLPQKPAGSGVGAEGALEAGIRTGRGRKRGTGGKVPRRLCKAARRTSLALLPPPPAVAYSGALDQEAGEERKVALETGS